MSDVSARLRWNVRVFHLLRKSTRPVVVGHGSILSPDEITEMRGKYLLGWSPEAFAKLLSERDLFLEGSVNGR